MKGLFQHTRSFLSGHEVAANWNSTVEFPTFLKKKRKISSNLAALGTTPLLLSRNSW